MFRKGSRGVRVAAVALGAVAFVTGAAACGGDEKPKQRAAQASFASDYRRISTALVDRSRQIQTRTAEVKADDTAKLLDVYEQIRASSQQAHDELRQLTAPPAVRVPLANVVALLARQNAALGQLITAAQKDDRSALAKAMSEVVTLTRDFDTARAELERAITACGAECG